ncbi:MAG: glycosyltransferase family 4 protein [Hadesarchaea archaeon]|nr:glycosyltransferase family 4 protein [Hadesarchaea archaeon]
MGLSKAERWLGYLRGRARELGVEDRVIFAGYLKPRELQAAYERCEVVLLPSLLEGFGLVVIEGWVYRKPCLVSRRAGVAELIKEGENGLLFDPLLPEELAGKLSLLLSDERLAASLGEGGKETSSLCSLERGVEEEAKVMRELVGE